MESIINIKPLSVNEAWQGKRFKTCKYNKYQNDLLFLLPNNVKITNKLFLEFGITILCDIDNPVKPFLDILCKKYDFDDRSIIELTIKKEIVSKGSNYIKFKFY